MIVVPDAIPPDSYQGVHRVTLVTNLAPSDPTRLAELTVAHIDATRRANPGAPSTELECHGFDSDGTTTTLWLCGSVLNWAGLLAMGIPIGAFETAAAEALRQKVELVEVRLEHQASDHAKMRGLIPPWSCFPTEIDGLIVDESISLAQLEALALALEDATVRHYNVRSGPMRASRCLFLDVPLHTFVVGEVIATWALCVWADPMAVRPKTGPILNRAEFIQNIDWSPRFESTVDAAKLLKQFLSRNSISNRRELMLMLDELISTDASDAGVFDSIVPDAANLPRLSRQLLVAAVADKPEYPDRFAPVLAVFALVGPIWFTEAGDIQVGTASLPLRR